MGRVLQKLAGLQLAKKAFEFYETRRFITTLTDHHLSASREPDQTSPHPTSSRYSFILSSHLRTGLPSGLFPSDRLTKPWLHLTCLPYALHTQPISLFLIWSPEQYLVRSTDHKAPIMYFSPLPCYLYPLRPKYLPQHSVLDTHTKPTSALHKRNDTYQQTWCIQWFRRTARR